MLQMSVNSGSPAAPNSAPGRSLAQLPEGEAGVLDRLELPDDIARRLMELGFLPGHIIVPARSAPGGEPRVYRVDGSEVALRRETASRLILRPGNGTNKRGPRQGFESMSDCHGCAGCAVAEPPPSHKGARPHVVAIIGPPNSGKSTLFNRLTGLRQKVANFPGVTVEQRVGKAKMHGASHDNVVLVDLPGVYSLNPRSEDEQVTRDVLAGTMPGIPKPDALLLILDCTNLGRHLVLAAPILSLKLPTLVILNMADDLKSRGGHVDTGELAAELGSPVALISASKGQGIEKVFQFMEGTSAGTTSLAPPRVELPVLQDIPRCRQWAHDVGSGAGYHAPAPPIWTRRLDSVFLHPIAGPLIFLIVVAGVFQTIFSGAKPLMDGLQALIQTSGQGIEHILPPSIFRSLLVDGVWSGVGAVIVFLPQILLLFLFIGILEDSGLPGARRSHCRPHHGQVRPAGKILHPADLGLRLRRAGHHGHAHHRE